MIIDDTIKELNSKKGLSCIKEGNLLIVEGICYLDNALKPRTDGVFVEELDSSFLMRDHTLRFKGEKPFKKNGGSFSFVKPNEGNFANGLKTQYFLSKKPVSENFLSIVTKIEFYRKEFLSEVLDKYPDFNPGECSKDSHNPAKLDLQTNYSYLGYYNLQDVSKKLEKLKIGIIGVGGTGSHILDMVSKTPVKEIHIFDKDTITKRNFFRIPGGLYKKEYEDMQKVEFFKHVYENLGSGTINAYSQDVNDQNLDILSDLDFVFISIDRPEEKRKIIDFLKKKKKTFIDVGMGVLKDDKSLSLDAALRTVACVPNDYTKLEEIHTNCRSGGSAYDHAQIIELNALQASLAVIKWKKIYGFYTDDVQFSKDEAFVYGSLSNKIVK